MQGELSILPLIMDGLEPDIAAWTAYAPYRTQQLVDAAQVGV